MGVVKRIEGYLRYFLTSLGATVSEPDSFETFDVLQKILDEATAAGVQDAELEKARQVLRLKHRSAEESAHAEEHHDGTEQDDEDRDGESTDETEESDISDDAL